MMRRAIILAFACLLGLGACSARPADAPGEAVKPAEEAKGEGVAMDAETQAKMGVKSQPVVAGKALQRAEGFARVVDVGPLAAIESEVSAAVAAAAASDAEYRRLQMLATQDQAASIRQVEAARAQAANDAARAKLAARRVGLEWGASLEKMSDSARSRLLTDIASGKAAMLRIDSPGADKAVTAASIRDSRDGSPIPVAIIGQAAAADAKLQTTGLLGIVRGAAAASLPTGRLVQADLDLGVTEDGFILPAGALVRVDSGVFIYVKSGGEHFTRKDVGAGRAIKDGWFIAEGLNANSEIVTEGAASLLAAEQGPAEAE